MKSIVNLNLPSVALWLCLALLGHTSCKPKPIVDPVIPTEAEKKTALLIGTAWVMSTVKVDDVVVDLYTGLSIVFTADKDGSNGKYSSVNGGAIWPASGTWKFKDEQAKVMVREDGLEISIDDINEKSMTISFTRTGETIFEPGGRTKAVGGKHVLTLGR